jgi:hypothetical protein
MKKQVTNFPPYHFYKNVLRVKNETQKIHVDEKFTTLRLYNLQLIPKSSRNGLNMVAVVEGDGFRKEYRFRLSELFDNPNIENFLFFKIDSDEHIDIDFPEGRKWISIIMEMLVPIEEYDIRLTCEYLTK